MFERTEKNYPMKKIPVILLVLLSLSVKGQLKGFSLGPFAETGWPSGGFKETNHQGIGGGVAADVRLGKIGITGSMGYLRFEGKTTQKAGEIIHSNPVSGFPVRAGLKYRLAPAFYAKLEGGVVRINGEQESALLFSPGIGFRILGFELQGKYEVWKLQQPVGFWGIKGGFNF